MISQLLQDIVRDDMCLTLGLKLGGKGASLLTVVESKQVWVDCVIQSCGEDLLADCSQRSALPPQEIFFDGSVSFSESACDRRQVAKVT
jgi:hypothetical protein